MKKTKKYDNEFLEKYRNRGYAFNVRNALILGLEKAIILNTLGPIFEFEKIEPCPDGKLVAEEFYASFPFIEEKKFYKLIKEMKKDGILPK